MANRIKELRKIHDFTLLQIAERLGISESTVQRYESGNIKNLKYETIISLADIFDCNPSYLMGWSDDLNTDNVRSEPLMKDEQILLSDYRKLNQTGKARSREYVASLTYSPTFTTKKIESSMSETG